MKNRLFFSKLIFIIFWFCQGSVNSLSGQIIFEPTFINQCSKEVLTYQYWTVSDSSKTFGLNNYRLEQTSLPLPKLGKYKLHVGFNELEIDFTINKNGVNRDTFLFKRITQSIIIGPGSEYLECGKLADGEITDYYHNGQIRMKGLFKKGQLIDSLFSYNRNEQLTKIFIPKKKGWKEIKYFPNGKIKSEEIISTKKKSTLNEYFPNGFLKRKQSHKKLEIYNQKKIVIERMRRKEILIFERIFKKKKHGREKFYTYKWESFDDRGILKRKIIFDNDHFQSNPFPDSIQQINDFLFEEIVFYFNGNEFKKVALELEAKKKLSRKLVIYRKEENKWVREKTTSISKVHEMIENYSN